MSGTTVVARVGGSAIPLWHLLDTVAGYAHEVLHKTTDELTAQELADARAEALDRLVGGELLWMEAQSAGYRVEPADLDDAMARFVSGIGGDDRLRSYLAERSISIDEMRAMIEKQLVRERFAAALVAQVPPLGDDERERYYQSVKDRLSYPPRFTFRSFHVESPTQEQRERFMAAFDRLAGRAMEPDFVEAIARDAGQVVPGVVERMFRDRYDTELPAVLRATFAEMEPGRFTPVYDGPGEISVFYLAGKELFLPMTEEDGRREASQYLDIMRLKRIIEAYIGKLKEKYPVDIMV